MKFTVSRVPLLTELLKVSRAVSPKSPVPTLTGIKIEGKDDTLYFTGSDSDISIHSYLEKNEKVKLEIVEEGSIILGARYICEIVRKIDDELITIEIIDGALTRIFGDTSDFKINGFAGNDYPVIDFTKPEQTFTIKADILKQTISQTIFATSDKETRPVLTGVNVKCDKNNIYFVATDSYRLAKKTIPNEHNLTFAVTIPAKTLNEVSKTIEDNENLEIAVNDKKIQFVIGNSIIQSRLIEGAYPETSRLIPTNIDYELTVNAHVLLAAIDRASLMKNDGINIVKLSMNTDKVEISSKSQEVGTANEILNEASFVGKPLDISFSGKYACDAIRAISSEILKISFSGDLKPFVIRGLEEETCLQLILPTRTYN